MKDRAPWVGFVGIVNSAAVGCADGGSAGSYPVSEAGLDAQ
jgi:hypothetical protein